MYLFALIIYLSVASCSPSPINEPAPLPSSAPTISENETSTATPTQTQPAATTQATIEQPASPAPPTVRPTDTPTLTPTPRPLTLVVPERWQKVVTSVIQPFEIILVPEGETADFLLTSQPPEQAAQTILVHQEPLSIAVPFLTNWHHSPLSQAKEIALNGHELAIVVPWRDIPTQLRSLRIDGVHPSEANYPLTDDYYLVATENVAETAVSQLATALSKAMADDVVHLSAVGDIMLDRFLGEKIKEGDLAYPFAKTAELLAAADLTIGNVESALGDVGEPVAKAYPFRAPPEAAEALAVAGFDVVSLANNHGMDYGTEALLQALELLNATNVAPIGAGANADEARRPQLVTVNGFTLALLGYVHVPIEASTHFDVATWTATQNSPGLAWADLAVVAEDVEAAKATADYVIVVLHSGYEYVDPPSPEQLEIAETAVSAGADLIIGHHAHILQAVQYLDESLIVYGLGNFAFQIDGPPETAVLNVWLAANGIREFELIPAIVQFGGQPRLAEPWEAEPILRRIYSLSRPLNP